ncbi:MAG: helix-turn-helix domain-containing protein [Oscillospiraceae bacterium]|nr:helix-turn-helix domain-containing protein [Oscillospiraceae bacterium]
MVDKFDFAKFIKEKRNEKNLTQEQLANMLFVSATAVSKWERGVTYPDITLISKICEILEISEHEFVTACDDTETRRVAHEAKNYRRAGKITFWSVHAAFLIPIVICFIVNLAVNHALSWFFVALASLACGYSAICLPFVLKKNKSLLSMVSATLSAAVIILMCKIFGYMDFSLLRAEAVLLFCSCLPWGIWAACKYTKTRAAFILMITGIFIPVVTPVLDFIIGEKSQSVPFFMYDKIIFGGILVTAGFLFLISKFIKRKNRIEQKNFRKN